MPHAVLGEEKATYGLGRAWFSSCDDNFAASEDMTRGQRPRFQKTSSSIAHGGRIGVAYCASNRRIHCDRWGARLAFFTISSASVCALSREVVMDIRTFRTLAGRNRYALFASACLIPATCIQPALAAERAGRSDRHRLAHPAEPRRARRACADCDRRGHRSQRRNLASPTTCSACRSPARRSTARTTRAATSASRPMAAASAPVRAKSTCAT